MTSAAPVGTRTEMTTISPTDDCGERRATTGTFWDQAAKARVSNVRPQGRRDRLLWIDARADRER